MIQSSHYTFYFLLAKPKHDKIKANKNILGNFGKQNKLQYLNSCSNK